MPRHLRHSRITADKKAVDTKEILTKAALNAAISGGVSMLFFNNSGPSQINFAGMRIQPALASAIGGAGASITTDLAHDYVLPMIPKNKKYESVEATALGLGVSALTNTLVLSAGGQVNKPLAAGLGAGSYVASDYIYHKFIDQKTGGILF